MTEGWLCTRCQRVNAPTVLQCPCSPPLTEHPSSPWDYTFIPTTPCPLCGARGPHACITYYAQGAASRTYETPGPGITDYDLTRYAKPLCLVCGESGACGQESVHNGPCPMAAAYARHPGRPS